MPTIEVKIEELADVLKRDEKKLQEAIQQSVNDAAAAGVGVLVEAAPVAFGHLRQGVHVETKAEGAELIVDAPYAAAVENGCRPHMPPRQPIIDWVLVKSALFGLSRGDANKTAAGKKNAGGRVANFMAEVERIANAVRFKIAREGIKPTLFVFSALPKLRDLLVGAINNRLSK